MWGEKKTKIVATLSDFRANEEFVRGLFEAGMDVVRINSAHVTEEGAAKIVEAVRRVNPAIPVILDTKGPEIRVTAVADEYGGAIGFQTGERVKVRGTADGEPSTRDTIYFNVATVVRDIATAACRPARTRTSAPRRSCPSRGVPTPRRQSTTAHRPRYRVPPSPR